MLSYDIWSLILSLPPSPFFGHTILRMAAVNGKLTASHNDV